MATTIVHPSDPTLRPAIRLALLFAALKLALHIATTLWQVHLGYGYFRDEFYYIACGRHLAWGFVDHGPIVALQARLALLLFGKSLLGIRLLSALAGAIRVYLTGILCWALGGRRPAQALALTCVLVLPIYLALDGYLSMNSFESFFWMTALLALILQVRASNTRPHLWLLWGAASGVGLLNKPSMTFFLIALLLALLLTPQRRLLATRWAAAGILLMLVIAAPNLLWQIHNHWPTLEFLRNGQLHHKNVALAPLPFLVQQILILLPPTALVWLPGLVFLLRSKPYRFLALTYLFFLAATIALHAKDYYVTPIYPILFAAGGLAWERRFAARARVQQNRAFAFPLAQITILFFAIALLPLSIPVLRPPQIVTFGRITHLGRAGDTENEKVGPLGQFYADRFGWQEEVDLVTRTYNALPAKDRAQACLWGSNYGEAGAIDFLGRNLPAAISSHNNYFLWGPHGCTGELVIAMTPTPIAELQQKYEQVEVVGRIESPWSMPYEHRNIVLLRHRRRPLLPDWPATKEYI